MSPPLRIVKMSGAGNDFVVIGRREAESLADRLVPWVRRVCRRGLSVGADGVLIVEPSSPGRIRVSFLNPDGAPAFCGNGSRCAARYALVEGLAGDSPVLETDAGEVPARIVGERVYLTLPPPRGGEALAIEVSGSLVRGHRVLAGVPHFVVPVDSVERAPLELWGPALRRHPRFGDDGTNVDVMERVAGAVSIRTWERGVEGETLACGSGAVAVAHAARLLGWTGREVSILPRSGIPLSVELAGPAELPNAAILAGDARIILEATIGPEATEGFEA